MSFGYSQSLVKANKAANARSLGVALGRHCIERDISVRQVADRFKVSRMTVYSWFKGAREPRPDLAVQIQRYIQKLR